MPRTTHDDTGLRRLLRALLGLGKPRRTDTVLSRGDVDRLRTSGGWDLPPAWMR